jgi:Bacteriophage head to tail connecting protein
MKQYEQWVDVIHVIMPNEDYNPNKPLAKHKKFISCYYEKGISGNAQSNYLRNDDKVLRESGYDLFPVLCPRWEVTGEDVYGTSCPGMEALGDIKQLQLGERRSFEAIEKMIRPPMIAPSNMRNHAVSMLPGDITYSDLRDGQQGLRAAYEVNFRIQEMEMKQDQIRNRIQRAFFEDLFLMLAQSDRRQITAREIEERHEEKLLALGPVLEQLNQDLLDPLIDIAFHIHLQQGLLPPAPEELQDVELKVEYISIMAQAQKLVGIAGIERFSGFVGQIAQFDPNVMDKLNTDQAIDVYADITSVPAGIVRTDEEVDEIRMAKQQAAQAQQQAALVQSAAATAKDLSQADMEGTNALTTMTRGIA